MRKRLEERYKTTIKTAIDGFWLVDSQGRILDVNDAYGKLTGYSREGLQTMSITDIEAAETDSKPVTGVRMVRLLTLKSAPIIRKPKGEGFLYSFVTLSSALFTGMTDGYGRKGRSTKAPRFILRSHGENRPCQNS